MLEPSPDLAWNFSYFPILVGAGSRFSRDDLYHRLRENGIFARRYFYPLISEFPMYADAPSAGAVNLPVAARVAREVLCLPIYPELTQAEQMRIIDVLRGA
jgi:dTDP-4-amino-4,6-dideoxygalactose transaminase